MLRRCRLVREIVKKKKIKNKRTLNVFRAKTKKSIVVKSSLTLESFMLPSSKETFSISYMNLPCNQDNSLNNLIIDRP